MYPVSRAHTGWMKVTEDRSSMFYFVIIVPIYFDTIEGVRSFSGCATTTNAQTSTLMGEVHDELCN